MSNYYPDLTLTQFPDRIDGRYLMIDPTTQEDMTAIASYNSYIDVGDMEGAIQVLNDNPRLQQMFFNAEKWNRHDDMIIALEKFFWQDVDDYLFNLVKWRGEWDDDIAYSKYDVVYYIHNEAAETYMAIRDVPVGILPTNLEYFVPITLRGQKGASGAGLSWHGAWKSYIQFYQDDCACYNGKLYAALQDSMGQQPDISPAYWEEVFALDASSLTGIVAVVNGGTGINTLAHGYVLEGNGTQPMVGHKIATAAPQDNNTDLLTSGLAYSALIAKADKVIINEVTAPANGWVNFEQTLTVPDAKTNNVIIMSLNQNATRAQREVCWNATISPTVQGNGTVKIVCDGLLPRIDLPLVFAIMGLEGTWQAEQITGSLAQIQTNSSDISSINSVITNFQAAVAADNTAQDARDDKQDDAIARRAGALKATVTGNGTVTTNGMDTSGGVLHNLIINGSTTQSGSGEPSTSNIRMLSGIGDYDAKITYNGTETWTLKTATAGHVYFECSTTGVAMPNGNGLSSVTCLFSYGNVANPATAMVPSGYVYKNGTTSPKLTIRFCPGIATIDTVAELQTWLASNPLTVWYKSESFATTNAVYAGVSLNDGSLTRGYAGGVVSPMFDGDYVDIANKTSVRDKVFIVFNGNESFTETADNDWLILRYSTPDTTSSGRIKSGTTPVCNMLSSVSGTATGYIVGDDNYNYVMYLPKSEFASVAAFQTFLQQKYAAGTPMQIMYQLAAKHASDISAPDLPTYTDDVTITGSGNLSVTYSQDLTAAINDIYSRLNQMSI